ncbi:hypothetical protein NHX12_019326, partial [Muraenolepis orangiensis]
VNFVVSQLFALLTALWFRLYLHPSKTSPFIRHVVATLLGFYLALFCFGWYALHFLVQSGLSYSIMVFASLEHMHNAWSIQRQSTPAEGLVTGPEMLPRLAVSSDIHLGGFKPADGVASAPPHPLPTHPPADGDILSGVRRPSSPSWETPGSLLSAQLLMGPPHSCRYTRGPFVPLQKKPWPITRVYVFDYGMYSADFTGPMMKYHAVRRMPSLLEFLSYNCNFMSILAGPTCSYNDYTAFIEGTGYHPAHQEMANGKENGKCKLSEPSPKNDVIYKLCTCAVSLGVYLALCKVIPVERSIDPSFVTSAPFYQQVLYLYLAMLALRPKYYFVWTLADAINNAAGFGFNGYKKDGSPRWDRVSNLKIMDIEFATSFKMFLDSWNIQTALWLKRVCYERCPINPTAATFLLSAIWHGVYPGYYLTFLTGTAMTMAARALRHNLRPHFQTSDSRRQVYDVMTWAGTQVAISYTVVPFVLLAVGPSLKFYRSWYYCMHLLCLLLVLALPVKARHLQVKEQQQQQQQQQQQACLQKEECVLGDDLQSNHHATTDNNCNKKDT